MSFSARPVSEKLSVPGKGARGLPTTPQTAVRHGWNGVDALTGRHGPAGHAEPGPNAGPWKHCELPGKLPHVVRLCCQTFRVSSVALAMLRL